MFIREKNNFVGAEILPRVSGRSFILVVASVRESIIDNYARCPLTLIGTLFRCNDAAEPIDHRLLQLQPQTASSCPAGGLFLRKAFGWSNVLLGALTSTHSLTVARSAVQQ